MSLAAIFKTIVPQNAGKYKHRADLSIGEDQSFAPQETDASFIPQPPTHHAYRRSARRPKVVVNHYAYPWYYPTFWGRSYHRETFPVQNSQSSKEKEKEDPQAGVIAAFFFFGIVLTVGLAGIAYCLRALDKLTDNVIAGRKLVGSAIKSFVAITFGLAGLKVGISLGSYYGLALFGSGVVGATLAGLLLVSAGIALGLLAGKYLTKMAFLIYSKGKTSSEASYVLTRSAQNKVNHLLITKSEYAGSRANLMYCYLINKIEIAKTHMEGLKPNKSAKEWLKTLKEYAHALKKGELPEELMAYFNEEWQIVHNDHTEAKQASEPSFKSMEALQREQDLKALAIITSREDLFFTENFLPSAPAYYEASNDMSSQSDPLSSPPPFVPGYYGYPNLATQHNSQIPTQFDETRRQNFMPN